MELQNNERLLLLSLVKEDLRKAQLEKDPSYSFNGKSYVKPKRKYGIKRLTALYEIESKLRQ